MEVIHCIFYSIIARKLSTYRRGLFEQIQCRRGDVVVLLTRQRGQQVQSEGYEAEV